LKKYKLKKAYRTVFMQIDYLDKNTENRLKEIVDIMRKQVIHDKIQAW